MARATPPQDRQKQIQQITDSPQPSLFDSALGPQGAEVFLQQYWQQRPLYVPQAWPEFDSPISAQELAGLACEAEVESRLIVQNPAPMLKDNHWQLRHGPFSEADFAQLPASHWTLLVQALDHWVTELYPIRQRFNLIPNWRFDDIMLSYAAPGGNVGPHFDYYDVFLLQAEGTRRWQIGDPCDATTPVQEPCSMRLLQDFQAQQEYLCQPGDLLYIPPGVSHYGIAEDNCLTYSIGFRAPSLEELLQAQLDHPEASLGSNEDQRYRDNNAALSQQWQQQQPGLLSGAAIEQLRQLLLEQLQSPDQLARWFGNLMTEPKYPDQDENQDTENRLDLEQLKDYLATGGTLHLNEGSRLSYYQLNQPPSKADAGWWLFADGQCIDCQTDQAPLLRLLCDRNSLTLEHLDDLWALKNNQQLLLKLVRLGIWYLQD